MSHHSSISRALLSDLSPAFSQTKNGLPVAEDSEEPMRKAAITKTLISSQNFTTEFDVIKEKLQWKNLKVAELEAQKKHQLEQTSAKIYMQGEEHKVQIYNLMSGYELALKASKNEVPYLKRMYSILQAENEQLNKDVSDSKAKLHKNENFDSMRKKELNKDVSDLKAKLEKTENEIADAMRKIKEQEIHAEQDETNRQLNVKISDLLGQQHEKDEIVDSMENEKHAQKSVVTDLTVRNSELEAKLDKKNKIIDAMENEKHAQNLVVTDFTVRNSELEAKLEQKNKIMDAMEKEQQKLMNELEKAKFGHNKLVSNLSAQLEEKCGIIETMEKTVIDAKLRSGEQEGLISLFSSMGKTYKEQQRQLVARDQESSVCMKGDWEMGKWVPVAKWVPVGKWVPVKPGDGPIETGECTCVPVKPGDGPIDTAEWVPVKPVKKCRQEAPTGRCQGEENELMSKAAQKLGDSFPQFNYVRSSISMDSDIRSSNDDKETKMALV